MLRGTTQAQMGLLQVGIVALAGQGVRVRVCMRRTVHHLSYFGVIIADVVGEFRFLESGSGHALIPRS